MSNDGEELWPNTGPALFYVLGQPATGRTTVARKLAKTSRAPLVNQQQLLDAVTGPIEVAGVSSRARDWTGDILGYYLLRGLPVIFDAETFTRSARAPYLQLARALGVPAYGIWVQCEVSTQDLLRQGRGYSPELIEAIRTLFQAPQVEEGFRLITSYNTDLDHLPVYQ